MRHLRERERGAYKEGSARAALYFFLAENGHGHGHGLEERLGVQWDGLAADSQDLPGGGRLADHRPSETTAVMLLQNGRRLLVLFYCFCSALCVLKVFEL